MVKQVHTAILRIIINLCLAIFFFPVDFLSKKIQGNQSVYIKNFILNQPICKDILYSSMDHTFKSYVIHTQKFIKNNLHLE